MKLQSFSLFAPKETPKYTSTATPKAYENVTADKIPKTTNRGQ